MADDDDDASFGGAYENGHWIWDDSNKTLAFLSDLPPEEEEVAAPLTVNVPAAFQFKDLDLIEQMRFRKRYQRKVKQGEPDVITVQDLKNLTLYTAPIQLLSPTLINFLHIPTTERFIRALILYCHYYLQIKEEMGKRMFEAQTKVRTEICEQLESTYRENLSDLRSIVAKEYCTVLIGGDDTKKFHHMGPEKKRRSLSSKDARGFETVLRICIQIVWLALGRRSLNHIELEVNRIFKSEIFNTVEHTLQTGYLANMMPDERSVLLGECLRSRSKPFTRSPLANEVFCVRHIDYRAMGLGVIKYDTLYPRLRYLLMALAAPEHQLVAEGVTVGILGLPRSFFDTMLHVLPTVLDVKSKTMTASIDSHSARSESSKKSGVMKKELSEIKYVYPDIVLPRKDPNEPSYPLSFPARPAPVRPCSEFQRRLWQTRLFRLLHPPKNLRKSTLF